MPEYAFVMTGWDPVPLAGKKRHHSSEGDLVPTKRGRQVKKVDYYRLRHGKAVLPSTDPKTWEEAITSPEATE